MMWFLLLLCIAHIELVISQGDVNRLILRNGNNPCKGHVEIYHNGIKGYVGAVNWNKRIEEVVCRSTHCGMPSSSSYVLRPIKSTVWLNELRCNGNESHLWDCYYPGWGISDYPQDTMKMVICSNEIKFSLEGSDCAGAVKYSTEGGRTSGYFCADNWGMDQAKLLCEHINCGEPKEFIQEEWMGWKEFHKSPKMMINCSGIENVQNLWQCVTQEAESECLPATVICEGYDRLQLKGPEDRPNVCHGQLEREEGGNWNPVKNSTKMKIHPQEWCQQMHCGREKSRSQNDSGTWLTCTDNVSVTLMDNGIPSPSCYGTVHIEMNTVRHPVCASSWTQKDAEVVCKELNCGKVIFQRTSQTKQNGIMDNVKCTGKESSLWHCRAKRDNTTFPCSSSAYVVCAGPMNVELMDGLGKCAGRVEIEYKGQFRRVAKEGWTENNSNTICKQMNCGNEAINQYESIDQKYTQGSSEFLDLAVACDSSARHISECIKGDVRNPPRESTAVMITCEKHKAVFLNDSCSGKVGIEHGGKTYWLSGSKKTWSQESADAVCREMHCGEASSFTSIPNDNTTKDIWDKAYSCSSDATSLFNCSETQLPSDYNDTTLTTLANVTCSEKIKVNLTRKCWGNVNVCVGTKCGGVCKDSWTIKKSDMLCKNLDCGEAVPDAIGSPEQSEVHFKSLHLSNYSTNLNQCKLVKNGEKETTCSPAYVVCSASFKRRFVGSRSSCSGNVEMSYGDQWFPVCMDALSDPKTQNTICKKCGKALKTIDYFGSVSGPVISQISCSASAKSFKECKINFDKSCTLGGLRCSGWRKTELKTGKACSGDVYVHSEGNTSSFSREDWTETKGDELCQGLGCGKLKSFNDTQQQLGIECQGEPSVTLSRKCGGEVMINKTGVCNSTWNLAYSHKVCQEHGCSNAVSFEFKPPKPKTKYHHVTCEDYHHRLGQCNRFEGQCDGGVVSVHCVGSVQFRTTETCGGQIEVNYRNKWEKVCLQPQFPYEMLCKNLGCNGHNRKIASKQGNSNLRPETTLNCTKEHNDIRYCVSQTPCGQVRPAEIYCDGYVLRPTIDKTTQISVVPIILGVGSFLVLVILIVVCVRVYMVRKAKRLMNVSPRMMSREEAEFESGDSSKYNEMEDFGHGESEVIRVVDVQSTSSFPYDDIDEAQPLTSEAAAATGAPGDNYIRDRAIDQSSDGVTYEVEDPPDNYDDIETGPEISQTKVEVHDSPQTTAESVTVTPPGLVLEDEGYLVPGQDV